MKAKQTPQSIYNKHVLVLQLKTHVYSRLKRNTENITPKPRPPPKITTEKRAISAARMDGKEGKISFAKYILHTQVAHTTSWISHLGL